MSENELEVFCLKLNCPGFACKCKKEEISRLTQDNAGCKELRQEFDGLIAVSNRLTQELEAARGENEKLKTALEDDCICHSETIAELETLCREMGDALAHIAIEAPHAPTKIYAREYFAKYQAHFSGREA